MLKFRHRELENPGTFDFYSWTSSLLIKITSVVKVETAFFWCSKNRANLNRNELMEECKDLHKSDG